MNWKEIYESRKCTAQEAVQGIKSGDRVVFAHCVGEPKELVTAMVDNAANYKDVTISHMVSLGEGKYTWPEYRENFRWDGWFTGGSTRSCLEQGHGDFVPVFFHEVPKLIRQGHFPIDVMMVMVSPPDVKVGRRFSKDPNKTMHTVENMKIPTERAALLRFFTSASSNLDVSNSPILTLF